ncbi:MAG TPA: helix-turn-helix transcriptional regulator [Kiritimatiellia bacterium]|nr:helix-turn-helix transcriptional regulator [Kiritimatiellia bacterium]
MGKQKTYAEHEIAVRVGSRIRKLRELQGITQIKLATDIGIRAGPLGWIEKGKHLPSGRVLYRLAKRLNVRIDDLFQEKDVWDDSATPTDAQAAVVLPPVNVASCPNAEALKATHIICQTVAEALPKLEKLAGVAPRLDFSLSIPFTADDDGAKQVAAYVRQGLGIGNAMLTDYLELFENAGLRVVFMNMPEGCTTFSGYDPFNQNGFVFINSNLKKQPEVQMIRATLELGRVFWYVRKQNAQTSVEADTLNEKEFAYCFMLNFLLPATSLRRTVLQTGIAPENWTFDLLLRMKKRYGVSARCLAMRLQELGLSRSDKQKHDPHAFLFEDELEAFQAEKGSAAEPGGNRPPCIMNGRIGDLLLVAEQKAGKDMKPVNAIKRVLRQSGVRFDT